MVGLSAGPFQLPEQIANLFMGFLTGPDDQCPAGTPIVDSSRTALGCPMAGGNGFLDQIHEHGSGVVLSRAAHPQTKSNSPHGRSHGGAKGAWAESSAPTGLPAA